MPEGHNHLNHSIFIASAPASFGLVVNDLSVIYELL